MLIIFLFIISIIIHELLTKENNTKGLFLENKIYELNDTSFENIIEEGKLYRWLILFYSDLNQNSTNAKKEIENIFNTYKDIAELRFAQMNINENLMTSIRLNISKIPYIILLENETIYEMNLTLTHENLDEFIFTIFSEVKNDLKILPKKVDKMYIKYILYKQKLDYYVFEFNQFLLYLGIKIHLNLAGFFLCILFFIILIYYTIRFIYNCCYSCCNEDDLIELEKLEEEFNNRKNEIENEDENEEDEEMFEYPDEEEEEEEDDDEYDDTGDNAMNNDINRDVTTQNNHEETINGKKKKIEEKKKRIQ